MIAIPYRADDEKVVELVNYSQEPIAVQVRIKGVIFFDSLRGAGAGLLRFFDSGIP